MQRDMRDMVVFELGSEEWAVLPDLGVPAILAKTDTGAKTSALQATRIEVYDAAGGRRVRFCVHPIAGRLDIFRACDAPLVAQRWVASSNGARELRCVVATRIQIGPRAWPIEVTLTNRRAMRYRMLLGKRAMLDDMIVVPSRPSLQRVLGYGAYAVRDGALERGRARTSAGLRIGLLGEGPVGPFWQALADAALRRGHVVERIDVRQCSLVLTEGRPRIVVAGQPLPRLSCVIAAFAARADATTDGPHARSFALAVLRQIEQSGAVALNGADALALALDPVHACHALWARQIPLSARSLGPQGLQIAPERSRPRSDGVRVLVVGNRVVACPVRSGRKAVLPGRLSAPQRRLALAAARALGLDLARIDLGPAVGPASAGAWHVTGIECGAGIAESIRSGTPDAAASAVKLLEERARIAAVPVEG